MKFRNAGDYTAFAMMHSRSEQYKAAQDIADLLSQKHKRVCVTAPVKAGKKEVMIAVRLICGGADYRTKHSELVFFSVTSLNRKDCREQIQLLNDCQIESIQLKSHKGAGTLVDQLIKLIGEGKEVVLFIDESDYGTAYKQMLARLYSFAKENSSVTVVGISATNYEMEFAKDESGNNFPIVRFIPAPTYRGSEWFLDNDLAEWAVPFLSDDKTSLSEQGSDFVQGLMDSLDKYFLVVRLRYGNDYQQFQKLAKKIESEYPGLKIVFADGKNSFNWSPDESGSWHGYVSCGTKTMIVICQTCTRSTEIGFHKHIYGWHDYYDPKQTPLTTALQAVLRVAHYDNEGHAIRLACNITDLQIDAGEVSKDNRLISHRVSKTLEGSESTEVVLNLWFDSSPSEEDVAKEFKIRCQKEGVEFKLKSNFESFKPKFSHTSKRHGYSGNVCQSFLNGSIRSTAHVGGLSGIHFDAPSEKSNKKEQQKYHQEHLDAWEQVMKKYGPQTQGRYVVLLSVIDPRKEVKLSNLSDKDRYMPNNKSMFIN